MRYVWKKDNCINRHKQTKIRIALNALIDNMSTSAPNLLDILSNHSNELDVAFKEIISGQELNSEQREQLISLVDRRGNGSFKNFALNSLEQVIKEISQEIKLLNEELNDLEKGKTIQPSKLRKEFTCGVYASMVAGGLVSLNPVGFGLAVAAVGAAILDGC